MKISSVGQQRRVCDRKVGRMERQGTNLEGKRCGESGLVGRLAKRSSLMKLSPRQQGLLSITQDLPLPL